MSSHELDRVVLQGEIIDDEQQLLTSPDEARQLMSAAMDKLQAGLEYRADGLRLLGEAYRRRAWTPLGFSSWADLVRVGIGEHFRATLAPQAREELIIELRNTAQITSYRAISDTLGISHSTAVRTMQRAREEGRVPDEPEKVISRNGAIRDARTTRRLGEVRPQGGRRRADLLKSWRTAVIDADRRLRSLQDMCLDDRYPERRSDIRMSSRGDLVRMRDILTTILADFETFAGDDDRTPTTKES
jgi:hypothetical protein